MVKKSSKIVETPQYSLNEIKKAAQEGRITISRVAERDAGNAGYLRSGICDCICHLRDIDFKCSHQPPRDEYYGDAYRTEHTNDGVVSNLYVKVRLDIDGLHVLSFKLK